MIVYLQHGDIALACHHLIPSYFSHFVLSGKVDHQMVGWGDGLPWIQSRATQYGVVCGWTINNQECDILGDLLRVITDRYGQNDRS